MKKLVCEICGSQHLAKQDDFYVCESCGTKFSAEEAKKLLVDVNVTIDNSAKTEKMYEVARRAFDNGDYQTAETNYRMILNEEPNDWEAYFLSVYCTSMQCKIGQIESAANRINNCLIDTFKLIASLDDDKSKNTAVELVSSWCVSASTGLMNSAYKHFTEFMNVNGSRGEFSARGTACFNLLLKCADCINANFPYNKAPDINKHIVPVAKQILKFGYIYSSFIMLPQKQKDALLDFVKPHDPAYVEEQLKKMRNGKIGLIVFLFILLAGSGYLMYIGKDNLMGFAFLFGAGMALFSFFGLIAQLTSLKKKK